MTNDRRVIDAILRRSPMAFAQKCFETVNPGRNFIPGWYVEAVMWELERCQRGETKRLIITLPPRYLKSHCASVVFPAWILGHDPTRRIICVSYAEDLAASFSRQSRQLMEQPWYRSLFPGTRFSSRKNTEMEIVTTREGSRYTTSIGGTLTGKGANYIIIDDPLKSEKAMSKNERDRVNSWLGDSAYSRLDSKADDVIVLVMQRLHVDDLAGHLIEKGGWTVLNLPAIAQVTQEIQIGDDKFHMFREGDLLHPEREDLETLEEIRAVLGTSAFQAQYLQDPVPPGGNTFKSDWFYRYSPPIERAALDDVVQSWDTAIETSNNACYSVGMTWGIHQGKFYLLDVMRGRYEYADLKYRVLQYAESWGVKTVLIEKAASGHALLQDLFNNRICNVIPIQPKLDKEMRAAQASAIIEAGRVSIPDQASWLGDFEAEVFGFPGSKFNDQVDSMSQFLLWYRDRRPRELVMNVRVIGNGIRDRFRERNGVSVFDSLF